MTAGLADEVFRGRRRRLMDAYGVGSVIVVAAAHHTIRNFDVEHDWRQHSDFWYLSGFDEPDAIAVLLPDRADGEYVLFLRPRDKAMETWHGRRVGVEAACATLGCDAAFDIAEFDEQLGLLCAGQRQVVWSVGVDASLDQRIFKAARRHRLQPRLHLDGPDHFANLAEVLAEHRLFKSDPEISLLRRAAAISCEGHHEAMRLCRAGLSERDLQAALEYVFAAGGAQRLGYGSIVARGDNATILHYRENNAAVGPSDLVLIDAGAEYGYLTADITRTFPASGRFSPEQRAVYELVLDAQLQAIALCTPEHRFIDVHDRVVRVLTEGLVCLGLLSGEVDALIHDEQYRRFYMHRTSHWLGMDVHDCGRYHDSLPGGNLSRQLQPGMVLTVEPGIYIAADDETVAPQWRGIGVRIEDDILVTSGAPDNLTAACVKTIDAVEAMVGSGGKWVRPVEIGLSV